MSGRAQTFVVVGANSTGGTAAATLRTDGFDGRVVLIGAEQHPPYERPPLSKEYLRGEVPRDHTFLRPQSWYGDNDVELMLSTRAKEIDTAAKVVRLDGGDDVAYDKLLLATGGQNRRLAVPGLDLDGVHDLRTFEDADAIRSRAARGGKAVVVGAGFIGCEVTASLRVMGVDVEVVEPLPAPLVRVVGPEVARLFEEIHRDHSVGFHFGQGISAFEGTGGRVEEVVTESGRRLGCDFAVVGVGIQPVTELAAEGGLELANGIAVDPFLRTSEQDIFAAGDVADHQHPLFGRRLRVEHWDNALKMGAAAAKNMMGAGVAFDDPHWFWSDQYDYNLQYVGFAAEWDELIVRGNLEERNFVGFYVKAGVVQAAVGINRGRDVRRAAGLIKAQKPIDPASLRDEDVDLKKLAASLG
jgi:3-phenylpropionate/trans-cinnamate dioxygenase ferredoxin reductase subunit